MVIDEMYPKFSSHTYIYIYMYTITKFGLVLDYLCASLREKEDLEDGEEGNKVLRKIVLSFITIYLLRSHIRTERTNAVLPYGRKK